jgi:hypothetical protein
MDEDHHGAAGAAGPTVGLLEAARRICESAATAQRAGSVDAENVRRVASLLTAFATVYLVDRDGRPIRALEPAELFGAAVDLGGALVYLDGRASRCDVAVLESSLGELRERLAHLGILGGAD